MNDACVLVWVTWMPSGLNVTVKEGSVRFGMPRLDAQPLQKSRHFGQWKTKTRLIFFMNNSADFPYSSSHRFSNAPVERSERPAIRSG